MTPEAQRIAIAEAVTGVKDLNWIEGYLSGMGRDFINDLNAMHEAERLITDDQWPKYRDLLSDLAFNSSAPRSKWFRPHCCTAAQRSEAFLKTLGLWKD